MITICYISKDRPNHLKRSVRSLFSQTIKPEHIVITDCSDNKIDMDNAIEELKKESEIPITYVWKPKEELSRSEGRSLGREYVKTELMASTESDILYPPTLIEECLNAFGNLPRKVYVQPSNAWEEENGNIIKHKGNTTTGFFQAFRREDFDSIGGYNPFLKGWGWEDIDFSNRIITCCEHIIIPLFVTHMWHPSTIGMICSENNNEKNKKISINSRWENQKWIYIENGEVIKENIKPIMSRNCWESSNKRIIINKLGNK